MTRAKRCRASSGISLLIPRVPYAIAVTTAEVTDRKGALRALERCQSNLTHVQSLLCDSGYTGVPFAEGVREILGEQLTVQIAKRSELHTFKVMPKRWIVERSGEKPKAVEELRAQTQHQLAVHPSGLLGASTQKIVNRL
ncbi:IS4 family transposase [Xanthomonas fragariae]|uniref:IS4 family transposase n=1 Tax=Xanthomonas fragariae TaxID=48664 RepID=A0A1Y6HEZ6_9XANT|nr:hypothetical protein PD885_03247 [Xanthomonas fragariae]SMR02084.1 IS4 family transposase [Xanthomonas fragariae]